MGKFNYGSLEVDGDKLPETSVNALVRRGISHYFGNEQSAKVGPSSKWFKDFVTANSREPNAEEIEAAKQGFQQGALEALYSGDVGTSNRGPKVNPQTAALNVLARAEVVATLKANGIAVPKGEAEVEFADGTKLTMAQMIERRIAKHGERLGKEAAKKVAEDEKRQKKAREAAAARGTETPANADALDL